MPKWVKIVLIVTAVGLLLLIAGGLVLAKVVHGAWKSFEHTVEVAQAEGEGVGMTGTLDVCADETAQRAAACESGKLSCIPAATAFLWGCLESAPYDPAFCEGVPAGGDDAATTRWASAACAGYGAADDSVCAFALSVVPAFCASR